MSAERETLQPRGRTPRERAVRYSREYGGEPVKVKGGWQLMPPGGSPIVFSRTTTRFVRPTAAELQAGAPAIEAKGERLIVRMNSRSEERLVAARFGKRTDGEERRPVTERRPKVFPPRPPAKEDANAFARAVARVFIDAGISAGVSDRNNVLLGDDLGLRVSTRTKKSTDLSVGLGGVVVFSRRQTRFLNPTLVERRLAAEHGLDHTSSALVANRGSKAELSLLRHRVEEVRKSREKRPTELRVATEEDAERLLGEWGITAEIHDGHLYYRGTALANARIEAGRLIVESGGPSLSLRIVPSPEGDDCEPFVESLRGMLEGRWDELWRFEELLVKLGERSKIQRKGLRVGDTVVPLMSGRPLGHVVAEKAPAVLLSSCRQYLLPLLAEPIPTLRTSRAGVEVALSGRPLGVVSAHLAEVGSKSVHGDFFAEVDHWGKTAALLRVASQRVQQDEAKRRTTTGVRGDSRWTADLDLLPENLRAAAMSASEDIRLRRTAAYSHTVSLASGRFQLRFAPVELSGGVPFTAFTYLESGLAVEGRLWLRGASDPLALNLASRGEPQEEAQLHALLLLGFCALSVMPDFGPERARRGRRPRPQPTKSPRTRALPRSTPRRRSSPTQLQATGRTARAHWVVGHIRQLSEGHEAGSEAIKAAAAVGIALRAGETWVQPHVRGFGVHDALTFHWQAPAVVMRSLGRRFESVGWKAQ